LGSMFFGESYPEYRIDREYVCGVLQETKNKV